MKITKTKREHPHSRFICSIGQTHSSYSTQQNRMKITAKTNICSIHPIHDVTLTLCILGQSLVYNFFCSSISRKFINQNKRYSCADVTKAHVPLLLSCPVLFHYLLLCNGPEDESDSNLGWARLNCKINKSKKRITSQNIHTQ